MIIRKGVKKRNPSFSPPFHRFFMQDCQIQILRIVKKEWLLSPSFLLRRLLLLETRKRLQANYGFIQYCSKTLSIINIVVKIGQTEKKLQCETLRYITSFAFHDSNKKMANHLAKKLTFDFYCSEKLAQSKIIFWEGCVILG